MKMLRGLIALLVLLASRTATASSCTELVREAEAHEAAHDDDMAARRYTDALTLDSTCQRAYLGLAALRVRQGDGREAERVAAVALDHVPTMRAIIVSLARGRWLQGHREDAENALSAYADAATPDEARAALRELAGWYASEGKTPAQLAVWRRMLALAPNDPEDPARKEARTMVRALVVLVSHADPVTSPPYASPLRRAVAGAAKKL